MLFPQTALLGRFYAPQFDNICFNITQALCRHNTACHILLYWVRNNNCPWHIQIQIKLVVWLHMPENIIKEWHLHHYSLNNQIQACNKMNPFIIILKYKLNDNFKVFRQGQMIAT